MKKNTGIIARHFSILILIFCLQPLYSQEIVSIEITGLKRTKPHIAHYPLEKFLGMDGSTLDLNEVEAAVRDTGILEPNKIELVETDVNTNSGIASGYILRVDMAEKWTIIPFPVLTAFPGSYNLGLFIIDSNFLGIRDQAVVGGTFGTPGWMMMAMYNHTPNRRGMPGWNAGFSFSRGNNVDQDRDQFTHRDYKTDQLRFSFGMSHGFTDFLSASASVFFNNISLVDNPETVNPPESGAMILGISSSVSTRSSYWDGYLLSQRSFSIDYGYGYGIEGPSYHQIGYRAAFDQSIIPGFRLSVRSGGIRKSSGNFTSAVDPLFEDGPSRAQVNILPNKFTASDYIGLSAGLEKHFFRIGWGSLSAIAAWQIVYSQGSISGRQFSNGPFAEIRFYMSRIAVPGLGLGMAYNINSGRFQFGLNMSTGI